MSWPDAFVLCAFLAFIVLLFNGRYAAIAVVAIACAIAERKNPSNDTEGKVEK